MNNLRDNEINKDNDGVSNKDHVSDSVGIQAVDLASLSFFNSDPYFNFIYKKSERLCMAIYLITDFFPMGDSIKDSLRKSGTELLKVSLSLITASSAYRKNVLNDISRLCLEIVSLSKVASNLGMTSLPNHNVLEGEIKTFIGVIEEREKPSTTGQGFVLNLNEESYYHVGEKKEVMINIVPDPLPANSSIVAERKVVIQPTKSDTNPRHESVAKPMPAPKSVMQKNERQQIILGIVKEIGESSIKDIADNIKDCSEKTIQRELNTLIYNGVLKKIGERRWSKYVLA
jgi:hypothetical protein